MSKANYILEDFPKLKEYIENKIKKEKWSSDVISGYINSHELYKQEGFTSISTTTIYRSIHYGILNLKKEDTRRMIKVEKSGKYSTKGKVIKSITADNGGEFSGFLEIIEITNEKFYFCHPYASCEKGTNEKNNIMIRYFIPKSTLI